MKLHKTVQKEKGFEKQTKQIFMELSRDYSENKAIIFRPPHPNVMILEPDSY